MRALYTPDILQVWEMAQHQCPLDRALTVLAVACPELTSDELSGLSIGERDARLLTLREWTLGAQLPSRASCAACGEQIEMTLNVEDIRAQPGSDRLTE